MKAKNERGAIILESTYCILIAMIMFLFLMSFGFFLYQKTIICVVANGVAEEVSQTYKLRYVTDSSNVTVSDVTGVGKYRYLFFKWSFDSKNKVKAKTIATVRLSNSSLAKEEGTMSVDVQTVVDDIGRRHYVVTVKQKYSFLLGGLLGLINQKDVQMLSATSYVESADVLNYINTVKVTKYGIDKIKDNSSILGLIDSAIGLLQSVFDG